MTTVERTPGAWALRLPLCSCGTRKVVAWVLAESTDDCGAWFRSCPACVEFDPRLKCDGTDIYALVRERPGIVTADGPMVEIWFPTAAEHRSCLLAQVFGEFARLGRRRSDLVRANRIPPWALYRTDDGAVWAPGDPTSWRCGRHIPLPLRTCTIGRRRVVAKCHVCDAVLAEGSTAWQPDGKAWSSKGLASRFCVTCIRTACVSDGEPDGGAEVVRHLRVYAGGSEADLAPE